MGCWARVASPCPPPGLAGKAGNPFQTTQGNRLSCRDQEGRRGSEEAVPGPSVFPSGEPGLSGGFWVTQRKKLRGQHLQRFTEIHGDSQGKERASDDGGGGGR